MSKTRLFLPAKCWFVLGVCLVLPVARSSHAQNDIKSPEILVVHRLTEVLPGLTQNAKVSTNLIPQLNNGTLVLGLRKEEATASVPAMWLVKTPASNVVQGWVSANDLTPFSNYVHELKARAVALRSNRPQAVGSVPDLITIQNNPEIRQSWLRISQAIAENEMLPIEKRLPDPYFARAEIWSSVNNHFESLQDYLVGIRYARSSRRDFAEYSVYFEKLAAVANQVESSPVENKGAHSGWIEMAREHYSLGFSDYFAGAYNDALLHFGNCVSLAPEEPHYWYFRALTYRALGDDSRAKHDALIGAHFEDGSYANKRMMSIRLSRIQGPNRSWLEKYREGSVMYHILDESRNQNKK